MEIRPATADDAAGIAGIYNHYIEHTVVTFEETPVTAEAFVGRLAKVEAAGLPWYACMAAGELAGYAYAAPWKERSAYRFAAEVSVYLCHRQTGRGLGTGLYTALFDNLRSSAIRTVIGGITLPNAASVALHEAFGMRQVARFEKVGFKFGQWLDVGYWQTHFDA